MNNVLLRLVSTCALLLAAVLNLTGQQTIPPGTAAGFQLSGTLVDAKSGQPIVRARVAIAPTTTRDDFITMVTGEDGRFLFTGLAAGKYTLTAQARGYLSQSFNQHDQFSSSIVVGPDLDSSNLLFRLPPQGAISGLVTDEAGEPVRDALVILYVTGLSGGVEATRPRGRAMTNDEGAYHFGHLAPGRYLVAVSARPWYAQNEPQQVFRTEAGDGTSSQFIVGGNEASRQLDVAYPVTFFSGVSDPGAASPIVIGSGDRAVADISLQPVQAVHIRLPEGIDPSRGMRVELQKGVLDGPPIQVSTQLHSNQPGSFEIVGVAPGHYTLLTNSNNPEAATAESREIDVDRNGEIDKKAEVARVAVSGKLQFDGGAPSGQASLQLVNKKSQTVSSEAIGSDGAVVFKQGVAPGSYEVSLSSSTGVYVKSLTATGARVTGRTIEIRPGAEVKLAVSAVRGEGAVTGTALRDGKPCAGVMIVLVPADPAHNQVLFRRDQSDSDGTFTLANVVPGNYTLLAIENGWELEWMKPEVLKNYLGRGAAVQVQPSGKYDLKVAVQ